jgi:23S rRNA (adenine2503-C2)-methyltransferase
MDLDVLQTKLDELGEPAYRLRQIWHGAAQGLSGFGAMTDLPLSLRRALEDALPFSTLALEREARARDGTVKALFRTADGRPVETVLMLYPAPPGRRAERGSRMVGRRSLCLSSQSGCPLTCTFCATGQMRFGRNLTRWEILDQALHFRRLGPVDHAVFMGMGEPMMNIESVLSASARLPDVGIGHRRTAISTVGWIPGIERLAQSPMPIRLALSLHAADPALRSQLMPVNDRYPLAKVLAACEAYYERKRRKVFVEYVMLAGVNDHVGQAIALAEILDRRKFKVNLIPYNPTDAPYVGSGAKAIAAFRAELERHGIDATVRLTRGRDIDAACGQLAARAVDREGRPAMTAQVPARASPARSSRSRRSSSSSGEGSKLATGGRSSSDPSPNRRRNRSVVR